MEIIRGEFPLSPVQKNSVSLKIKLGNVCGLFPGLYPQLQSI